MYRRHRARFAELMLICWKVYIYDGQDSSWTRTPTMTPAAWLTYCIALDGSHLQCEEWRTYWPCMLYKIQHNLVEVNPGPIFCPSDRGNRGTMRLYQQHHTVESTNIRSTHGPYRIGTDFMWSSTTRLAWRYSRQLSPLPTIPHGCNLYIVSISDINLGNIGDKTAISLTPLFRSNI